MKRVTWIELPEIVEMSVQTSIIATKYVQLTIVSNLKMRDKRQRNSHAIDITYIYIQCTSIRHNITTTFLILCLSPFLSAPHATNCHAPCILTPIYHNQYFELQSLICRITQANEPNAGSTLFLLWTMFDRY